MVQSPPPPSTAANRLISIPSGFPVEWADPTEAQLLWMYNPAYYKDPVPPLDFELWIKPPFAARNKVLAAHGVPTESRVRQFNGYVYNANAVIISEDSSWYEPVESLSAAEIDALVGNLQERWDTVWLPEIQNHLAVWEEFDLPKATLSELIAHLDVTETLVYRLQEIHIELSVAMFTALHQFEQIVADFDVTDFEFYNLLAGFETQGIQSSRVLWQLSRMVLMEPEVYWVLSTTPLPEVLPTLAHFDEGKEFCQALQRYLAEFGYQGEKNFLNQPSWHEDPTPVLQILRAYVNQTTDVPITDPAVAAAQRKAALTTVKDLLEGYPQPLLDYFDFLLDAAQTATWLREEHPHWLDLRFHDYVRQVVLAVGRRLVAAGILDRDEDIFYLSLAEVRFFGNHGMTATNIIDEPQKLVAVRRARLATYATYSPPPMVGTLPAQPLPTHPLLAALAQNNDVVKVTRQADRLQGHAASGGVIRGHAQIVQSPVDAAKLCPGDIMVTVTTDPSWTPLYANIAGLVTDMGGVLSHAAVVAREFSIPAVVGVGSATTLIKDGQLIEVNGDTGVVNLRPEGIAKGISLRQPQCR